MKRKWNVYMPFLINQFKRNLAYKGSFYLMMICSIFGPFISYYLWMAIYGSSPDGVLGGLSRAEMVVYIFMTYVTTEIGYGSGAVPFSGTGCVRMDRSGSV